jgi:hypothetical protein
MASKQRASAFISDIASKKSNLNEKRALDYFQRPLFAIY